MWNQFNKPLNLQCNEAKENFLSKHKHVTSFMFCFGNVYGYLKYAGNLQGSQKFTIDKN